MPLPVPPPMLPANPPTPMRTEPAPRQSSAIKATFAQVLDVGAQQLGLTLTPAQIGQLLAYLDLMTKWNAVYNLTAVRDPAAMITQHLLDSLSVVAAFAGATRVLDVGAGGGLPGIVLAIWAKEAQPAMQIALVDTIRKKTAFLTHVKAELGLTNVTVHTARVEQLQVPVLFDVITSRAFAELADFITWSGHLLAPGGHFLAMKGLMPEDEIRRLPPHWHVQDIRSLSVPTLEAERHLIRIARQPAADSQQDATGSVVT